MIKDGKKWIIYHCFAKYGKYKFEIIINNDITSLNGFFEECTNIIFLDLSNLDTSNVTDMYRMFHNCNKLKEIRGIDKYKTNKVLIMKAMLQFCNALEYLDLSNLDTSNVIDMGQMFLNCMN